MTTAPSKALIGALLHEIDRLIRRRFDRFAETTGMSRAQWHVLARVSRTEGVNQAMLADQIGVEPITISRMIDRLEALGLIERRPDPADRRARLLYTTEAARPGLAEMKTVVRSLFGEAFGNIDDEEREIFGRLLSRVHANLLAVNGEDTPFDDNKLEWLQKQLED
jgi:DNA-binding MarR family transcriptional regulator